MAWISVITDEEKTLTKHISLDPDTQKLVKTAPGHTTRGTIEALDLTVEGLGDLIPTMTKHQCLCLGVLKEPGKHPITCEALRKNGTAVRSKEFLDFFPESAFLMLDFDDSGLKPQEAMDLLATIDPQFATAGILCTPSSSSYLYNGDKEILGAGNFHLYLELTGKRDPKEYGLLLFDRLLLAGHGIPYVTKAGTIIIKSVFDKAVLSPEREAYVSPPVCDPPLVSRRFEHVSGQEGPPLNSDLLPDLTEDDKFQVRLICADLREKVREEASARRKTHNETRAKTTAGIKGTNHLIELANQPDAEVVYDKQGRPILELLSTDVILDEQGKQLLVRDLILEPRIGLRLPDPIEPYKRGDEKRGIPGKGIAAMLKPNYIYSHHHSGQHFVLRWAVPDLIDFFLQETDLDLRIMVWKSLAAGTMELSTASSEGDLSELADVIKTNLQTIRNSGVSKEKKHVLAKLRPAVAPDIAEDEPLLRMNAQYGMAKVDGKAVIISEEWREAGRSFEVVYNTPQALDSWTKNKHMTVNKQTVSMFKWWEQHPDRLDYPGGVDFLPDARTFRKPGKLRAMPQTPVYNLFQGYLYEREKAAECDLILEHIRTVWCSEVEKEFNYTIGWLAHLFQHPEKVSTTALVLQSVPGAGKGVIISGIIDRTLGIHSICTANSEDLIGRFNAHLGVNLFFYANEMSYTAKAGVKSLLKSLLTDGERMIEAKNVNKIKARNYSSVIFSANEDWLINIEAGDRRFVYLTVSSKRVGDHDYFMALINQIENGGREAFIKYLLEYDLSQYNPNAIPDVNHKQRRADFLRSTHPSVRMVWSWFDKDLDLGIYATHALYTRLRSWREGTGTLELTKSQFFDLFIQYCDYYGVSRSYDDASNICLQMESGGVLRRETDPRVDFPVAYGAKEGRSILVFKPFVEGGSYLKV